MSSSLASILLSTTAFLLLGTSQVFAASALESTEWLSNPIEWKGSENASYPQMAIVKDNIYAVWSSYGITFSRSTDGGNTFSEPMKLAENPRDTVPDMMYKIAASGDNVYVIYSNEKDVFLLKSSDSGATFSHAINVSHMNIEEGSAAMVTYPVISITGDRIYIAWVTNSFNWSEIFFAQSDNGGISFSDHLNISNNPQVSSEPEIASFDKYVYLAWADTPEMYVSDRQVSFAISKDGGHTFESNQNVIFNKTRIEAYGIQVEADEKYGYIMWNEAQRDENAGRNVISTVFERVAHSQNKPDFIKQIELGVAGFTVTNGKVYAVAAPTKPGVGNVAFIRSVDSGSTFSEQKIISNQTWFLNPFDSGPATVIAANGPNVFVAWRYTENSNQSSTHVTYLAASYNRGETFAPPINASKSWGDTDRDSRIIVAAGANDKLFLLWKATSGPGPTLWLVRGQIPDAYAAPYREVGLASTAESSNPAQQYVPILGAGAAIAGFVAFFYLKKKRII